MFFLNHSHAYFNFQDKTQGWAHSGVACLTLSAVTFWQANSDSQHVKIKYPCDLIGYLQVSYHALILKMDDKQKLPCYGA
jgi:hypothetical protein